MTVATLTKPAASPPERPELVPVLFDTDRIATLPDNPPLNPAVVARLFENMGEHGQLEPGFVYPSPDLEVDQRLCQEGHHRLEACRQLGIRFWAFDFGRFVPEEERIRLTFQHNHSRRVMGREEIAEWAGRYMDLTHCTQQEAARLLGISGPTLSRALGEKRIPQSLKPRTDLLNRSIRSLIAAAPAAVMERAVAYAEAALPDGKAKTRDQVAAYIGQLKKDESRPKGKKLKPVTLKLNGRAVTITLAEGDTVASVSKDLNGILAVLSKHSDMEPEGWPFLFK